ncbi:MAG TPA: hypothetical protein VJJ52_07815 [Candidatus Nanoarchaeia archaeon]|nr:hypothetical protein [Candidatus Nanoarchaeia archaeon]
MPINLGTIMSRRNLLIAGATVAAYALYDPPSFLMDSGRPKKLFGYGQIPSLPGNYRYTHVDNKGSMLNPFDSQDYGFLEVFDNAGNRVADYKDFHKGDTLDNLTLDEVNVLEGRLKHTFTRTARSADPVSFASVEGIEYRRGTEVYRGDSHDPVEHAIVEAAVEKFGILGGRYKTLIARVQEEVKKAVAPSVTR